MFPCVICGKLAAKSDPRCTGCGHSFAGELRSRYELGEGPPSKDERRVKRFLVALVLFDLASVPLAGPALLSLIPGEETVARVGAVGMVTSLITAMFTLMGVEVRTRWARWSSLILFGHAALGMAGLALASLLFGFAGGAALCLLLAILWIPPLVSSWRLAREISAGPKP